MHVCKKTLFCSSVALFAILTFIIPVFASITSISNLTQIPTGTNTSDTTPEISFVILGNESTFNFTIYIDTLYSTTTTNITANNTALNNTIRKFNLTNLANGTHNFVIETWTNSTSPSKIYASNSSAVNFTVDDTLPASAVTIPTNGTNTTDTTPEITFNLTDNFFGGTDGLQYRIYVGSTMNVEGNTTNSTITKANITAQTNATITVRVEGRDGAGNSVNSTPFNININTGLPVVVISSPATGLNTTNTTLQITFNITDNFFSGSGDLTYRIYVGDIVDGTNTTTNNTVTQYNLSGQQTGTLTVKVEGRDPAGNAANSSAITITADNTAPVSVVNSPSNGTAISDTTPEIQFTITDDDSNPIEYRVYLNGTIDSTGNATNNTLTYANLTTQAQGIYEIKVEGRDATGNSGNSSALIITIDTAAPTGLTLTLSASGVCEGATITGTCTSTDVFDSNPTEVITGLSSGAAGAKTATCTSTDNAGNAASTTAAYNVNGCGGGGGGGGGGGSSLPSKKIVFTQMNAGTASVMNVEDSSISFSEISINVNSNTANVPIEVTKLNTLPSVPVSGTAYQYVQVSHSNLQNENIYNAMIRFKVTNSWLINNNFAESEVKLYRLNEASGSWENVPVTISQRNIDSIEYVGNSPGLSTFAIVGEKTAAVIPPETTSPVAEETTKTPEKQTQEVPIGSTDRDISTVPDTSIFLPVTIVIVCIILAGVIYLGAVKKKP